MGNARRQVSDLRRDTDFLNFFQKPLTKFQGVLPPPGDKGLREYLAFFCFLKISTNVTYVLMLVTSKPIAATPMGPSPANVTWATVEMESRVQVTRPIPLLPFPLFPRWSCFRY